MGGLAPDPAQQAERTPRHRPAWIPTVAALVTVAVCVTAGNWQHRRMQQKEALKAQIAATASAPAVPLPAGAVDWRAWRFRTVTLAGTFDARRQILVDNAVHAGRVGYTVVTPLLLADGRAVLVDRGFVPAGPSRAVLPSVPPPSGAVTLSGRIDFPPSGYLDLGGAPPVAKGALWQHLDPARYAEATGLAVLPFVVDVLKASWDDGLTRDFPLPETGIEKHLSYMMQWYTFAAMAAGLWLWFTLRPFVARARRP
ncbi:MAG TPA: SURF1 family protein [Casimicrobiaceae bacterium]|nr:SURF1 family protein [Casimicrobiaceae bacterium]